MISVLIPTYNYNVYPLVREIHKQLTRQGVSFEILVYDDASTEVIENNSLINEFENTTFRKFKKNMGRTALRHQLAKDAQYENLLFLDADTFPKNRFYISKLLKEKEKFAADVYFGGIEVSQKPFSPNQILRWKYGKERETQSLDKRREYPYRSIFSSAIFIKKEIFISINQQLKDLKKYGLDIYFSYLLKENNVKIRHYHNPILHLGLENSSDFLNKTSQAIQTLNFLIENKFIDENYSKLSEKCNQIIKYKLDWILKYNFKILKKLYEKNLLSSHPFLFIFDIYKISYFCYIRRK